MEFACYNDLGVPQPHPDFVIAGNGGWAADGTSCRVSDEFKEWNRATGAGVHVYWEDECGVTLRFMSEAAQAKFMLRWL